MSKKQAISVINAAFAHIDGPQDGFMTVRGILYDMLPRVEPYVGDDGLVYICGMEG